jgi:sec-independent protein translocase protein TatC
MKNGLGTTQSQTFLDHVRELRRRVLWVVLFIGGSGLFGYSFRRPVIRILQHPLGAPLYYTSPAGSFNFVLKISFVIGIFIALPVIVYHAIRFIEPALPIRIKRWFLAKVILASFLLAVLGSAFGFYILIPMSLHFFAGYSTAQIKPLISATEYLSYVMNALISFAILFQIPLIILFINRIRPIKPRTLLKYQKHIVVGAFVIAVILPFSYDPITQFVMAVPIVFLYYLSIILLFIVNRRQKFDIPDLVLAPSPIPLPPMLVAPRPSLSPSRKGLSMEGIYRQPKPAVLTPAAITPNRNVAEKNLVLESFQASHSANIQPRSIDGILRHPLRSFQ